MGTFNDLSEQRYGRLVAIEVASRKPIRWKCRCDCGEEAIVRALCLRKGNTKSCGCLQKQVARESNKTHGLAGTPEHLAWSAMKTRCSNPNQKQWMDYGGRGIRVCERWAKSFEFFLADMGPMPGKGYTLERKDNDGNYEPGNARWATRKEQNRNTRVSKMITFRGQTKCVAEWGESTGLGGTLRMRLHRGWSVEKSMTTPLTSSSEMMKNFGDRANRGQFNGRNGR